MNNIKYWLDTQITFAKQQERANDEIEHHDDAMYWFGRWQALWDVKKMLDGDVKNN